VTAGAAYAAVRHIGDSEQAALDAAEKAWTSSFEDRDRHHAFVWGANPRFAGLLASRATPADEREGGGNEERTRFGALACRIWWPLLDAETLETP
jgi:exodeoxyribonuclease V gamma subunit